MRKRENAVQCAGIIQQDRNIQISTNLGMPIVLKEGTYISDNFERIVDRITAPSEEE